MKRQIALTLGWHTSRLMLGSFLQTLGNGLLGTFLILGVIALFTVDQWVNIPLAFIAITMMVILPVIVLIALALCFCGLTGLGLTLWVLQSNLSADVYLHTEALRQRATLINLVGFPILAFCVALVLNMALPTIGMIVAFALVLGMIASVYAKYGASAAIEHLQMQGVAPRKKKIAYEA